MENRIICSENLSRFDRHNWNPTLLRTQEEMNTMLASCARKRIKCINVIGVSHNLNVDSLYRQMMRTLSTAGIAYDPSSPQWQETKNRVMIPCTAKICEPIVIVFEDDRTLELRPQSGDGLLVAFDQTPTHLKDGLNNSCFDSEEIFAGAAGSTIEGISFTQQHREIKMIYPHYTAKASWDIHLSGKYNLRIDLNDSGWFLLTLLDRDTGTPAALPYKEMLRYVRGDDQICIVEGHNSSDFRILPVRHTAVTAGQPNGIEDFREEEISVEEDDVFYHLYYFLNKYFDKDYSYGEARPSYCGSEFEWSMEHNIYTYETVQTMLDEIEECAHLLKTDFHNEKLDGLKNKVCNHPLDAENDPNFQKLSAEDQKKELSRRIKVTYDFYERFVPRMRSMMNAASEYRLISFMGP